MIKAIIFFGAWLALPIITEFDYRLMNRFQPTPLSRKSYMIASVAEIVAFDIGMILGAW